MVYDSFSSLEEFKEYADRVRNTFTDSTDPESIALTQNCGYDINPAKAAGCPRWSRSARCYPSWTYSEILEHNPESEIMECIQYAYNRKPFPSNS